MLGRYITGEIKVVHMEIGYIDRCFPRHRLQKAQYLFNARLGVHYTSKAKKLLLQFLCLDAAPSLYPC